MMENMKDRDILHGRLQLFTLFSILLVLDTHYMYTKTTEIKNIDDNNYIVTYYWTLQKYLYYVLT